MLSSLARAALDEEPGPSKPAASRSRFRFAAPLVVDGAWPVGGTVGGTKTNGGAARTSN